MLKPLFNRVVIKAEPKKETISTAAGIIVSTQYDKTEEIHGKVVAVGPTCEHVKVDDIVSFPAYGYDTLTDSDFNEYMCIREPEITAVIIETKAK